MALLRVFAFGRLRLQAEQTVVEDFPTRHTAELFAYLVTNSRTPHTREKLVEILWPDNLPANGRASLSTTLWRLRSVLGGAGLPVDNYLQATRDWICFEPHQPFSFDVADFERCLKTAAGESEEGEIALRQAVALYGGEFCQGIYSEWCLLERERLERAHLRTMGQLMARLIQRQDYGEAIQWGQRILGRDPLREEVHRALMHCYWRSGRRAEGVRQFQLCARQLQAELQITPLPETISLYRQIVDDQVQDAISQVGANARRDPALLSALAQFESAAHTLQTLLASEGEPPHSL